jgi:hypothetical protein
MASVPARKFADVVVAKFTKHPAVEPEEPDEDGAKDGDDEEDEGSEPGERGKIILAAQRRGDPEALEEAIKSIVRDCMDEYEDGDGEKK